MNERFFSVGSLHFEYLISDYHREEEYCEGVVGAIYNNGFGETYDLGDLKALQNWLEYVIKAEEARKCGG